MTPPHITNPVPPLGLTENGSATFLTSGNPCLDLFFKVVPDTPASYLHQQLPIAWGHNALTTLKLICNLRGVRGTGKSDREGFYTAALWLHKHHPKTLAYNAESLAEFGYFKDLPEILYRLLEGPDVREKKRSEWATEKADKQRKEWETKWAERQKKWETKMAERQRKESEKKRKAERQTSEPETETETSESETETSESETETSGRIWRKDAPFREKMAAEKWELEKKKINEARLAKKKAMTKKALAMYQTDPDYRFLYDRISELFAECLMSDMEHLKANENKIGLAAKWCPSIDSSYDRALLICESIAKKIFTREDYPEYEGVDDAHYAYLVRDRLRKEVLVPLRKELQLPEVYIGANRWGEIPYRRVASVAMKRYRCLFYKHDEERFKGYLENVKAGKEKIAAGALLPHEIISSLHDKEDDGEVAELQWKRMVEDLVKLGKLRNCLAVCDVSGSMCGTPMEVCVALGLLVSELSEEPWKGKVITFSDNPQLHMIKGDGLKSKCEFVRRMDWGMNTDFQKVFDLILQVAVNGKLKPEQMIKRIFVFSDMEFDDASGRCHYGYNSKRSSWETDYEVIQRKYKDKGYGDAVPQIVFWNLRDSRSTPVPGTQPGVALLSGFSKNLLKMFLDNDGEIRPDLIMEQAISGEEYEKLVVID